MKPKLQIVVYMNWATHTEESLFAARRMFCVPVLGSCCMLFCTPWSYLFESLCLNTLVKHTARVQKNHHSCSPSSSAVMNVS